MKRSQYIKQSSLFLAIILTLVGARAQDTEKFVIKTANHQVTQADLDRSVNEIGLEHYSIKRIFPNHASPISKGDQDPIDLTRYFELTVLEGSLHEKWLPLLSNSDDIEYAEVKPEYEINLTPNDPELNLQWGLEKVQAYDAWDVQQGDTNVVVGVNDTGTDLDHSDLQSEMKHNTADPVNGIDDDQDGYVDNNIGWDFTDNNRNPQSTQNDHGIHVTGIAAAATNNDNGVASTGFRTQYLTARTGVGTAIVYGYEGIVYLADQGCDIINCSWGGFGFSQFGQDMVDYALSKNSLIVAAAGNNNSSSRYYPAAYEGVLAVGSIDPDLSKSSFSNYGYWVDIVAPGSGIYSTRADDGYGYLSGTSMAAPMVAGAAALLKAEHPSLSARQLAERLKATASSVDTASGNINYQNMLGAGIIQMHDALIAPFTSPAIDWSDAIVTDGNDNSFIGGDTIQISGAFTNYLAPSGSLQAICEVIEGDAIALNDTFAIGVLNTNFQVNNYSSPFRVIPDVNAPFNNRVVVQITAFDSQDTFTFFEEFRIMVDYINIDWNKVGMTVNSKGMLGYNDFNQQQGIGFIHESFNGSFLYEGGLMLGAIVDGDRKVVDRIRSGSANRDRDFELDELIHYITPDSNQVVRARGTFTDSTAAPHDSMGVWIEQELWAFDEEDHDEYIIARFTIVNNGNDILTDAYAGIFMDFDIDDYSTNWTKKIEDRPLMISWSDNFNAPYAGVGTLEQFNFNGYAIDNDTDTDKDVSPILGYPSEDKYVTLSVNRDEAGNQDGNDIIQVVSQRLGTINPGDTAVAHFVFVASTDEEAIIEAFDSAYVLFNGKGFSGIQSFPQQGAVVYPNPASDQLFVHGLEPKSNVKLFDLNGRLITSHEVLETHTMLDLRSLPAGPYTLVIESSKGTQIQKVIHQ